VYLLDNVLDNLLDDVLDNVLDIVQDNVLGHALDDVLDNVLDIVQDNLLGNSLAKQCARLCTIQCNQHQQEHPQLVLHSTSAWPASPSKHFAVVHP
jgi:hypothetical protein